MKYIIVDQFKNMEWIDVYLIDDTISDIIETKQGLSLARGFKTILELKKKYNIDHIDFKTYDRNEYLIKSEDINI